MFHFRVSNALGHWLLHVVGFDCVGYLSLDTFDCFVLDGIRIASTSALPLVAWGPAFAMW